MSKYTRTAYDIVKSVKNPEQITLPDLCRKHNILMSTARYNAMKLGVKFKCGMAGRQKMITFNGHQMTQNKLNRIMQFKVLLPQLDEVERLNADDIAARLKQSNTTIRSWCHILRHRLKNHNGRTVYQHDKSGWPAIIDPMLKRGEPMKVIMAAIPGVSTCSIYRWLANTERITVRERDRSTYKSASPN
jgi:hypothetical protein